MCKIKDEMRSVKKEIISYAVNCVLNNSITGVMKDQVIVPSHFTEIGVGVRSIICSLSGIQQDITVANCVFDAGGSMDPHSHDREERVHMISGDIMETVSGKIYKTGESIFIRPNQSHGWYSVEGCMLTVTWKPAFKSKEPINNI